MEALPDDKWNELGSVIRRFEDTWKKGTPPAIEEYLARFNPGDPCRPVLLLELLHVDLEYRVRGGRPVTVGGYLRRYPELSSDEAADLFARFNELRSRFVPATGGAATARPAGSSGRSDARSDRVVTLRPVDETATEDFPALPLPDRFTVVEFLGRGGMGEVWRVRREGFERDRVLKLILPQFARTKDARERMRREAQAMDRIAHPHAVIVHDFAMEPSPYIEMEFIAGKTLDKVLARGVPRPLDWTTRVVEQLCGALEAAHQQGVIHRDLKPSNLMLLDGTPPGKEFLKVLDFGIAKIVRADELTFTGQGQTLGTVLYMSPEQLKDSAHVTPRSDIYSVGAIAYECLTGYRPFIAETLAEYVYEIIQTPAPRFAVRNAQAKVPPQLEHLVLRCLEKDPKRRPASAAEFAAEFRRLALPPPPADRGRRLTRRALLAASLPVLALGGYAVYRKLRPAPPVTLPADWRRAKGTALVEIRDAAYPRAIERRVEGVDRPVLAQLVVPATYHAGAAEPFYIMRDKVWVGLFAAFVRAHPGLVEDARWQGDGADPDLPVMNVTGVTAEAFARWLGGEGYGFLPTPDQWDEAAGVYLDGAARGDHTEGPYRGKWVDGPEQDPTHPEVAVNLRPVGDVARPVPVGLASRDVSPSGCTDMSGNGREWTRIPDDKARDTTYPVVLRGASFKSRTPGTFEMAKRNPSWPFLNDKDDIGFRAVVELRQHGRPQSAESSR